MFQCVYRMCIEHLHQFVFNAFTFNAFCIDGNGMENKFTFNGIMEQYFLPIVSSENLRSLQHSNQYRRIERIVVTCRRQLNSEWNEWIKKENIVWKLKTIFFGTRDGNTYFRPLLFASLVCVFILRSTFLIYSYQHECICRSHSCSYE